MTPEQQKEEISKAYVYAVAASCGYKIGNWTVDDGRLDTTIGSSGLLGGGTLASPKLDLQLKCSNDQSILHSDFVSWTLSREHYDDLRRRASDPHLLVVLTLPEKEAEWIECTPQQLIIRRCAFWVKMTGMPEITDAAQKNKSVRLPHTQVFSPVQLKGLMEKLSREEEI
jgi:hypothetical protein